jgi:hypothetical protein
MRRVADLGQGWYGFDRDPEQAAEGVARLERILSERGRARSEIEVSVCPYMKPVTGDDLPRYREAGVDQVIALCLGGDPDSLRATLDRLAKELVEPAGRL